MKLLLAALALVFVQPQADSIPLRFTKGDKLTKTFTFELGLESDSFSMTIGGREIPDEIAEQFEMTMSMSGVEQAEDEYVSVNEGRTTELLRHYKQATQVHKSHMSFPGVPPKNEDETKESPLVDHDVVFTWDPGEEKYARAFRGDEGDKSWLEKLEQDMDFQRLLPAGKVEVGDTWAIEAKHLSAITSPGGSLSYPKKKKSDKDPFEEGLEGTIEARYDGTREVEGRKLAVMHLAAKLKAKVEPDAEDEMPLTIEFSFELEGEYLWDLEHGRLDSFELAGPAAFTASGAREIEANGQKLEMAMKFGLSGEVKQSGKID